MTDKNFDAELAELLDALKAEADEKARQEAELEDSVARALSELLDSLEKEGVGS